MIEVSHLNEKESLRGLSQEIQKTIFVKDIKRDEIRFSLYKDTRSFNPFAHA